MIVFPESPFIDIYPGSYLAHVKNTYGIRMWFNSKQSSCQCRRCKRGGGSIPGLERLHLRKKWQPTPVLLPGKSHGQRSLVGFSQWRCKDSNTNEQITHVKWQPIYQSCQRCHRYQRKEKWWILKIYLIIFRPIGILPGVDALVCHLAPHFGTETLIPLLLGVLSADDSS